MTHTETAIIDSPEKASRFLSGLGGSVGFDEAIRRVESKCSAGVREQLEYLARWVRGESNESPDAAFGMIGTVVRDAPADGDIGRAIAAADGARADAGALADHVRGSMLNGVAYLALLLIVGGIIAAIWLSEIAPLFESTYLQMSARMPVLSQLLVDNPWTIVVAIVVLGLMLVGVVLATRHLARSIESIAALGAGLIGRIPGDRIRRAHDRWRVLTLARAWSAAGEAPAEAVRRAAAILGADTDVARQLDSEMALATELGNAPAELDHLSLSSVAAYRNALELWRAIRMRFLQIAVALVVAVIVISIYMPIFGMGAIV